VAAGPSWATVDHGHEKMARPPGPTAGNRPKSKSGERKTFSFINPFIPSNLFDSKFKFKL
jgi:hypothetical protein